jgi:queuine tRNA-ribosyltransferase
MHSFVHPDEEARLLYAEQSHLGHRLREGGDTPLVLWDVGLGAAHNAMAAIRVYEGLLADGHTGLKPLHIHSFENDLDSLRLAMDHLLKFKHLWHSGPTHILRKGEWSSADGRLVWKLWEGEALELMPQAAAPHIVFYDPFSAKTNGPMWSLEAFQKLYGLCQEEAAEIFTYSASTPVRASLLAAGFTLAKGRPSAAKSDTTIALTPRMAQINTFQRELLDQSWFGRWERSDRPYPESLDAGLIPWFLGQVRQHPQWVRTQS